MQDDRVYRKYSRRHGHMVLRSYAPGDGSIDFNWSLEKDQLGPSLDEPVTESDVSEWLRQPGNAGRYNGHVIIMLGRSSRPGVPYHVRVANRVERPFGSSNKLVMDDVVYEYRYHGPTEPIAMYNSDNTDFYVVEEGLSREDCKMENLSKVSSMCFFLNHEKDYEASGLDIRAARSVKEMCSRHESFRNALEYVPKSMVGKRVGDCPKKIFREVEVFESDPYEAVGKRFIRAHRQTTIMEDDYVLKD